MNAQYLFKYVELNVNDKEFVQLNELSIGKFLEQVIYFYRFQRSMNLI